MTAGTDNDVDTAISNARLTRRFTSAVTILANGLPHLDSNDKLSAAKAHEYVVDGRAVKRLTNIGSFPTVKVEFVDGSEATFGFLVHRPSTKLRGSFAERLGLSTTPAGDISVINPFQESSRRGVFAAGDCATPLKQVAVAMAAGVTAGAGANVQIMQDDFEDGRW
jgi:thioredoxin reductase